MAVNARVLQGSVSSALPCVIYLSQPLSDTDHPRPAITKVDKKPSHDLCVCGRSKHSIFRRCVQNDQRVTTEGEVGKNK